jgi:hypothetical protein
MASRIYPRSPNLSDRALEAETLLNRYPDLSRAELSTLIRSFAQLPLLDYGLLAADERLGPKLEAFSNDHEHELRAPVSGLVWAMMVPAALALGVLVWAIT